MDKLRLIANKELVNKDKFAQFMPPSIVSEYMADLFDMDNGEGKSFLDCGAGIGSLTVPVIKRKSNLSQIDCWEIDPVMVKFLTLNMKEYNANIHCSDFIQDSSAGLIFISAFPDRKTFTRFSNDLAWETDVWIANNPTHMIHLNGSRFLGPYT